MTDVSNLLEYQRFRKLGISGKDARSLLMDTSLADYIVRMDQELERLSEVQRQSARLYNFQEEYCQRLRTLRRDLYRFSITTTPEMYYYSTRNEKEFAPNDVLIGYNAAWLPLIPFVERACKVPLRSLQASGQPLTYRYGLSIRKQWVGQFALDTTVEHVYFIPAQMAVRVVIATQDSVIERTPLEDGLAYIQEHRFLPDGDVIGNVLARLHDEEGHPTEYLELFFPIRE